MPTFEEYRDQSPAYKAWQQAQKELTDLVKSMVDPLREKVECLRKHYHQTIPWETLRDTREAKQNCIVFYQNRKKWLAEKKPRYVAVDKGGRHISFHDSKSTGLSATSYDSMVGDIWLEPGERYVILPLDP